MMLDRFIKKLLPRDDKFYVMLEESTQNLMRAAQAMKKLTKAKKHRERESLVREIKDLEHLGDSVTHRIFSELNATFVTPLDREDIHHLASSLDDIMDHIDGSASRFTIYKLRSLPRAIGTLVDILDLSIVELHRGVGLLRNLHHFDQLEQVIEKVNEYENEADAVFDEAITVLFAKEKNPIQVIKLKEILVGLETATDKCEDAANVLEGIAIKHA